MQTETIRQGLTSVETPGRLLPIDFEMAYQARVAIDRIKFAIRHTEQFGRHSDQIRDAGLQLLDPLERLEDADRQFQHRSRMRSASRNGGRFNGDNVAECPESS